MDINPANIELAERYKLLIGAIVPRPIAFVSTISPEGRTNIAPFSFFAGVSANPMTLLFCPSNKPDSSEKDTLRNIRAGTKDNSGIGGQFVVNIASEPYQRQMAATAEELPYGESEFDFTALTPEPSAIVAPPRLKESPISFECEAIQLIHLAPGQPSGGNIVLGRVLHIHAQDGLINSAYHIDPAKLAAVGRMAGITYCTTRDRFEIPWGRKAIGL